MINRLYELLEPGIRLHMSRGLDLDDIQAIVKNAVDLPEYTDEVQKCVDNIYNELKDRQ